MTTRSRQPFPQPVVLKRFLGFGLVLLAGMAGCATPNSSTSTTGANAGAGGMGDGGNGGQGGAGTGGSMGGVKHTPCSPGDPCPAGETCNNGICAAGCNTDKDCPDGQYCGLNNGQICFDKAAAACPATPCAPTQVCVQGLCGTIPNGNPCGPSIFNPDSDGCPADSLCLNNVEVDGMVTMNPTCYVVPPCAPDQTCSTGGAGSVCSAGLVTGKDNICIPGGCVMDQNCPMGWTCALGGSKGYGLCTDGNKGHPCAKQADCDMGLSCYIPVVTELGTCK